MQDVTQSGSSNPVMVLFRSDLRIRDNLALATAVATGRPVVCVAVFDQESAGVRPLGAARRWWLHHSLHALSKSLEAFGGRLILRRGPMKEAGVALAAEMGASAVFWNRRYVPSEAGSDAALLFALRERGVKAESFDGQLLHEPMRLKAATGGYYKVFGAFKRALGAQPEPRDPVDAPDRLNSWKGELRSDALDDWQFLPRKPDWSAGLNESWTPGEASAQANLEAFLSERLEGYGQGRDFPARGATSRLSPHLVAGEITPFQILARLRLLRTSHQTEDAAKLRAELAWREFCYHLLCHNPDLASANFAPAFNRFPWQADFSHLKAWQAGRTGYPIVDAGMRQLWRTGWMHNRIRMVVASFLTKHLLIDWREGEKWFWDTLVDADPANNPANWQWVAGSGADAAPYFRIFNPVLQGKKFDPDGDYTRRFVPELARLGSRYLHEPWCAPANDLKTAGVKLGEHYPVPLVEHREARDRALAAYKQLKGTHEDHSARP